MSANRRRQHGDPGRPGLFFGPDGLLDRGRPAAISSRHCAQNGVQGGLRDQPGQEEEGTVLAQGGVETRPPGVPSRELPLARDGRGGQVQGGRRHPP